MRRTYLWFFSPLNLYAQFDLLKEILRVACDIPGVKVMDPSELCGIICVYVSDSLSLTLRHPVNFSLQPARLLCPWDFPGKNTGVCCHFLLQGIFPTQGSNPCFLFSALVGRFFTNYTTWEATQLKRKCGVEYKFYHLSILCCKEVTVPL